MGNFSLVIQIWRREHGKYETSVRFFPSNSRDDRKNSVRNSLSLSLCFFLSLSLFLTMCLSISLSFSLSMSLYYITLFGNLMVPEEISSPSSVHPSKRWCGSVRQFIALIRNLIDSCTCRSNKTLKVWQLIFPNAVFNLFEIKTLR